MRKSKFNETQIVGILKDAESGVPVADLLRKHGVSKATFFQLFGAMRVSRPRRRWRATQRLLSAPRSALQALRPSAQRHCPPR